MRFLLIALVASAVGWVGDVQAQTQCQNLAALSLPNTTITVAEVIAPGAFVPQGDAGASSNTPAGLQSFRELPAFCRVAATLTPSTDSEIRMEVWMPTAGWNGKFQAVGNSGWGGSIAYANAGRSLAAALSKGYAAAATNAGHVGQGDGTFVYGHPEKAIDFAYRAVHEMTVQAKAIVRVYYGSAPRLSYWNGCSTGGRQGLKEAQRYPADYDGILAGAPANNWTHLVTHSLWIAQAMLVKPESRVLPEKLAVIHKAVLDQCDALDGVKDGVLEDPSRCQFDPKILQCSGSDGSMCLSAAQIEAISKVYAPARNPRTGQEIYPGLEPGSEMGWRALIQAPHDTSNDYYKYVVFKNPNWDYKTLDFDKDVALADATDNGAITAADPNLKPFFERGGKLLLFHGWSDPAIAPRNTINYYMSVVAALGGMNKIADSMRLMMIPGMAHCVGGEGTDTFDGIAALERWVEQKQAPDVLIGSRVTNGVTTRTRPLCAYPRVAVYNSSGSTDDAANFSCRNR
jgi:feruloyl esterase